MTPKKTARKQKKMPRDRLTERVLSLSDKSIKKCIKQSSDRYDNYKLKPAYLYCILETLASMLSCAQAILVLIKNGRLRECRSLQRSLYESFLNVLYILEDVTRSKELYELWGREQVIQINREFEQRARTENTTVDEKAISSPVVRQWRQELKRVRAQSVCVEEEELQKSPSLLGERHQDVAELIGDLREEKEFDLDLVMLLAQAELDRKRLKKLKEASRPRSWRDISMSDKEEALAESKEALANLAFYRTRANRSVHGGVDPIDDFLPATKCGTLRPNHGPIRDWKKRRALWHSTMSILLHGINRVVVAFYISGLRDELDELRAELNKWRLPKPSPAREPEASKALRPGGQANNDG